MVQLIVNFITWKFKSKHLVCLSFLWGQVFLREREKIFCTYSRPEVTEVTYCRFLATFQVALDLGFKLQQKPAKFVSGDNFFDIFKNHTKPN